MNDARLDEIRSLLARCTDAERSIILKELRVGQQLHPYEGIVGAPAEMILEAVHRAPELTRRMLRGVIADAAFRTFVVAPLERRGWRDVTPEGNYSYDYALDDGQGPITVQVKLQRSERGVPAERDGDRYGFNGTVFTTETQRTRTGKDGDNNQTRPYRYGEFDVVAVSMQPSCGRWDSYMYSLGRWLISGSKPNEIATIQPVTKTPSDFWTDDFEIVAAWMRSQDSQKRMEDLRRPARNSKKRGAKTKKKGTQ